MSLELLLAWLFAAPLAVYAAGQVWPRAAGWLAVSAAAVASAGAIHLWWIGGDTVSLHWVPSWSLRVDLAFDGLAALYAQTATAVGTVVIAYAVHYMPAHLEKHGRPLRDAARFHALMLLFMAAMVGLAVARELYTIMICWDITAVVSFLLIGSDWRQRDAQRAAVMAMIVTAGTAVLFLAAIAIFHASAGTTLVGELTGALPEGRTAAVAAALVLVAAFAKSAQAPLHFWLPTAMVAPTPVSAYLHSAAMVAAGVLLTSRLYPALSAIEGVQAASATIGVLSIATGSLLALRAGALKRVLAYSTIAQYGYVMLLLGIGGAHGTAAAGFYVVAHALAKSALFLTAGAAIEATGGRTQLEEMGGLARPMPWLAAGSAVAAASLSALPPTIGFFKDELFYKAALEHGPAAVACAVGAAALTFAYTWRWWTGIFLGPQRPRVHDVPALLPAAVVVLGLGSLAAGIHPDPIVRLADAAAGVMLGSEVQTSASYHLQWRTEYTMATTAIGLGLGLLLIGRRVRDPMVWTHRFVHAGPERLYDSTLDALTTASDYLHAIEVRDLRDRVAAVLAPGGLLVLFALAWDPAGAFRPDGVSVSDLPLAAALLVASVAALAATRPARHLHLVVGLSAVSYAMAIAFALFGAPDVALVAVAIQIVSTLLILAVFSLFPERAAHRAVRASADKPRRYSAIAWLAGVAAFGLTFAVLSWPAGRGTVRQYVELAPRAHADDVVTGVLADFRGFDTIGEATAIAVALLGVATLLGRQDA